MTALAWIIFLCAVVPTILFLANLPLFSRTRRVDHLTLADLDSISVLIPARNEERSIGRCLEAVLRNRGINFEVIVFDDHSEDRTRDIVSGFLEKHDRVKLIDGPSPPHGWNGKQHACYLLSKHARHPLLLFLDADVRLEPTALARLSACMASKSLDLLSGVPRQVTGTIYEKLTIPLIHFLLLGYLPMVGMRFTRHPAFAAGCGQLMLVRAKPYEKSNGHAAIRQTLHDGLNLPKSLRRSGFSTGLADVTDLAWCRMYRSADEVREGLLKNAVEGVGSPKFIVPWTALIGLGQVAPWLLLPFAPWFHTTVASLLVTAAVLSLIPRLISIWRFQQSVLGAVLHPIGFILFLSIQWSALYRHLKGIPQRWKGRAYAGSITRHSAD